MPLCSTSPIGWTYNVQQHLDNVESTSFLYGYQGRHRHHGQSCSHVAAKELEAETQRVMQLLHVPSSKRRQRALIIIHPLDQAAGNKHHVRPPSPSPAREPIKERSTPEGQGAYDQTAYTGLLSRTLATLPQDVIPNL